MGGGVTSREGLARNQIGRPLGMATPSRCFALQAEQTETGSKMMCPPFRMWCSHCPFHWPLMFKNCRVRPVSK